MKRILKENVATYCLMLAMFFNPMGFDILFKAILDYTSSYWITTGIFYCISALFFGLFFLLRSKK